MSAKPTSVDSHVRPNSKILPLQHLFLSAAQLKWKQSQHPKIYSVDLPDGSRLIPFIKPVLGRDYIHAPESPVITVGCIGILLHFERVVLDIVNSWEDDPLSVFFDPGKRWLHPGNRNSNKVLYSHSLLPSPLSNLTK